MEYEVLKPFNTVNRRLVPGDGPAGSFSTETDLIAPFEMEERVKSGFLRAKVGPIAADPVQPLELPVPKPARRDADSEK